MQNYTPASLFKRLVSLMYEALLLAGVTIVALALCIPIIQMTQNTGPVSALFITIILLIAWWLYFKLSMKKRGQTLPMQIWRISLINRHGNQPNQKQLLVRYIWSVIFVVFIPSLVYLISRSKGIDVKPSAGLATIWWILPWGFALMNREKQFVYDILAGTRLVNLPKSK